MNFLCVVLGVALSVPAHGQGCLPELLGTLDGPGFNYIVRVEGSLLYSAAETAGLQIIDVSDPTDPTNIATYNTPGLASSVFLSNGIAFVCDSGSGLQVIDVSVPSIPVLLGNYDTPGSASEVVVEGGLAYVADWTGGLHVIGVADPGAPSLIGTVAIPGSAVGVKVADGHAYIASLSAGLHIVDVTDPSAPVIVGSQDTPGTSYGVWVEGLVAYVADGSGGLQVIDVSDPQAPVAIGQIDLPGTNTSQVTGRGSIAYVTDVGEGLHLVDVSNPASPVLIGSFSTGGSAYGADVDQTKGYIADGGAGVIVLELGTCLPIQPMFLQSPQSAIADAGGALLSMSVVVEDADSLQWRRDGAPIVDSASYFGTESDTLVIAPELATEGVYDVLATNEFGSAISQSAVLAVRQTCDADVDGNGILSLDDIDAFVASFLEGCSP